jgi:cellulose synthase/poly-beta-1,6-N-acetylglucosamine synthase-like glycosyltransferase
VLSLQILAVFSLIFSLFLLAFCIRALVFFYVTKKNVYKNGSFFCVSPYSVSVSTKNSRAIDKEFPLEGTNALKHGDEFKYSELINTITSIDDSNYPFISILVATYNERLVVEQLMKSAYSLTYPQDRFEIIVVDDSDDGTLDVLKAWKNKISNLKIIHRNVRIGWKGGALNLALENMDRRGSYALVLDADSILPRDTLERFVLCFTNSDFNSTCDVIQGYPVSDNKHDNLKNFNNNWVARAIDFRLAQRNIVEFFAKDQLNLPLQITGSFFMIRADLIRAVRFSNDLCEDWYLTLDVNFYGTSNILLADQYNTKGSRKSNTKKITFNQSLISYCQATTRLRSYFKQRMRVSEGHTRGFRRNTIKIIKSRIPFVQKVEFFFTGLRYTKSIAIFSIIAIDAWLLAQSAGLDFMSNNMLMKVSLVTQACNLSLVLGTNFILSKSISRNVHIYGFKDALYLLYLNICVMPAFVFGSVRGLFRTNGTFYKTERNL